MKNKEKVDNIKVDNNITTNHNESKLKKISLWMSKEKNRLFSYSIIAFIGGLMILASSIYTIVTFISPKKLAKFVSNSFTGDLKDNFVFSLIHYWSFLAAFIGTGLIIIYSCLIVYHITINRVLKRYMWGLTLVIAVLLSMLAIAYTTLESFILEQIKSVTFAKDDGKYTFKPASWITKVIGTKDSTGEDGKINYSIYVMIIELISFSIGIITFICSVMAFTTNNKIVDPEVIKSKKLVSINKSKERKEQRLIKKQEKNELKIESIPNEPVVKKKRTKKGFADRNEVKNND